MLFKKELCTHSISSQYLVQSHLKMWTGEAGAQNLQLVGQSADLLRH